MLGGGGLLSFYILDRSVPGEVCMETPGTAFRRIRSIFPLRLSRLGTHPGSADPGVRPSPGWALLAPPLAMRLVGGPLAWFSRFPKKLRQFDLSSEPFYPCATQGVIIYALFCFLWCFLLVFAHGCLHIIIHQSLWKWLELNPYSRFWCLISVDWCRSWRLICDFKDSQQHPHT
jgi:hypothetical protein